MTYNTARPATAIMTPTAMHETLRTIINELKSSQSSLSPEADEQERIQELRNRHHQQVQYYTPEDMRKPAHVSGGHITHPDGSRLPIRVYRPLDTSASILPTVLWLHGGGWVTGDLETADPIARLMADAGAVVVTLDYRRAPESPYPAALEDCLQALQWIHSSIASLGGDRQRIGIGGDSAGGNLAAAVAQSSQARHGGLAAQLLLYPLLDANPHTQPYSSRSQGHYQPLFNMTDLAYSARLYATEAQWSDPRVSPILSADLAGVSPVVLVTAGYDILRDEARDYAERLRTQDIEVIHHDAPQLAHGVFDLIGALPQAHQLLARAIQDLLAFMPPPSAKAQQDAHPGSL